jgi:hypothetical protein
MLRRNMSHLTQNQRLALEDLLGDLWHARKRGDLGRLALLLHYEVRRWARMSGEQELAEHSSMLVEGYPYADRDSFLDHVDRLISELEQVSCGNETKPVNTTDDTAPLRDISDGHRPRASSPNGIRH